MTARQGSEAGLDALDPRGQAVAADAGGERRGERADDGGRLRGGDVLGVQVEPDLVAGPYTLLCAVLRHHAIDVDAPGGLRVARAPGAIEQAGDGLVVLRGQLDAQELTCPEVLGDQEGDVLGGRRARPAAGQGGHGDNADEEDLQDASESGRLLGRAWP